ncbi:secretion-regulating guanine nucleotide exchange factor-like isoform X2 [Hylaeus anthracinus]|uniref:secretion-regulating guanine nucleotide exchange factor-like isoform X2 n=1 Tax=Hylaeus anthracinus TaxID=313031 RepID=UPI0023B8BAAF|nr:secretion-regulating guanine nucleotide exchange factor-like isoform X2 [Hylaeus anthracinus]
MSYCLISWGANSHGQLGQDIQSEECVLARETDLSRCSLQPESIKKIVGGAGHTLILDNHGHVYSCGWNNKGQAGFPINESTLLFRKIEGKLNDNIVVDVACGWDCSAALTINGTLFLWGANNFGQLGKCPKTIRWTHEPFELAIGRKIKRVSIGLRHTALVTEDRKVLVAGSGNKGQLGLSPSEKTELFTAAYAFTEIPTLTNIQDVVCGQHHTIAITENGTLFAFGDNKHGQLSLDTETLPRTSFPIKLPNVRFNPSVETHSGWSHMIALNDCQIFSWGRNTYGQLGCAGFERPSSWKIVRVEGLPRIRQVSVGSEHNVVLTEDGRIFCWGWNEHGNCGNGHTRDVKLPEQLSFPSNFSAIRVGSGAGHSLAVIKKS